MQEDIIIRRYHPSDRREIRRICCDSADRGEPVENFFSDRELIADLATRYYTDDEPQSLWVAECKGRVVGYLSGCLDTRRYSGIMLMCLGARIFLKALMRGVFLQKDTWRLLAAGLKTWYLGGFRRAVPLTKYPAHLHINIEKGWRDKGIGAGLIEHFLGQLKTAGIAGMHLSTLQDNIAACNFFKRMGFIELGRYPVVSPRDLQHPTSVVIFAKDLTQ